MRGVRGNGAGIEIGAGGVRAVRLAADAPGRVVAAVDERIFRPDVQGMVDALVRAATRLSLTPDDDVTIAWFGPDDRITGCDVTGRSMAELAAQPPRAGAEGADRWVVDAGPRRWQLDLHTAADNGARIRVAATRAGLPHARFEPAPLALARLASSLPRLVWRVDRTGVTWCALCVDGIPVLAGAAPAPRKLDLGVVDSLVPEDEHRSFMALLEHEPAKAAQQLPELGRRGASRHRSVPDLTLLGDPYPDYPDDDVRSLSRQCVALGAALAAAGLGGRVRTLRQSVPIRPETARRPWLVERIQEPADPPGRSLRPWRRRRTAPEPAD